MGIPKKKEEEQFEEILNCEGFLNDMNFWSHDVAENLAKASEVVKEKLTEDHWKVINYIQQYYKDHGRGPAVVRIVENTGVSLKSICKLFPCGLVKGAYKIAGLPKPPGCT